MNCLSVHSRLPRLAAALALLAMVAQLWMGQIGAEHLARHLANSAPASDICSAQDSTRDGGSPLHQHLRDAINCLVSCAATAPSSVTLASAPAESIGFARAAQSLALPLDPQSDGRHRAALRPPAQAPPAA